MLMKFLVVGGAGYIGSHMVQKLHFAGHQIVTFDNLSNGHRDAVLYGEFVEGDLNSVQGLSALFEQHEFDQVIHFGSFIEVDESVIRPDLYYQNNVANTLNLLDTMVKFGVKQLIFSSTAALFGRPVYTPIDEQHPIHPINPYGNSKYMVEQILADYDQAFELKSICLRYFNAAGADPEAKLGERHNPETHLIPLVLQAAIGEHTSVSIFGKDYPTPDGTCVRDYIHIQDLCDAHLCASHKLSDTQQSAQYNLGNGNGFSVQQVIDMAQQVVGDKFQITTIDAPRRTGDSAVLVAQSDLAKKELNWRPQYGDLKDIITHAWQWQQKMSNANQ